MPVIRYGDENTERSGSFGLIGLGRANKDPTNQEHVYRLKHERGHNTQLMRLGPSYIAGIAVPSLWSFYFDRPNHKFYPWEKWADALAGL